MSHRLAGFSLSAIEQHRAHYEAQCGAEINIPDVETEKAQSVAQREGGVFFRYRVIKGHLIPKKENNYLNNREVAGEHFEKAWRRFESFLRWPMNGNLIEWAEYLKGKRAYDDIMVSNLYEEICRRFECFYVFYHGIDEAKNIHLLFRQAVRSKLPDFDTEILKRAAYTFTDSTIADDETPDKVADLILSRSSPYGRYEARENLLILMVANAYLCKSMIHTYREGKPDKFTDFIFEVLHHSIVKLSELGLSEEMFRNHFLDAADFARTFDEIRSEVQKAPVIASPRGLKMLDTDAIDYNKATKAAGVCVCIDRLEEFVLGNVISRKRLARQNKTDDSATTCRQNFRELCVYARRTASFQLSEKENGAARLLYNEAKGLCMVLFSDLPIKDRKMFDDVTQMIEFMLDTEYHLPRSVDKVCNAYSLKMTTAIPLTTAVLMSAHQGARSPVAEAVLRSNQ